MKQCTFTQYISDVPSQEKYILGCIIARIDTQVGIFALHNQKPQLILEYTTKTSTLTNFTDFIQQVLTDLKNQYKITIDRACVGVPGNPSANKDIIIPFHHPFIINAHDIKQKTSLETVLVVNDFEVIGFGITVLDPKNVIQINPGIPRPNAPQLVIGVGNGLGSCLMIWDTKDQYYRPSPLAFAYTDFTAQPSEYDVVDFIKKAYHDNISWGYMLGLKGGIKKMYEFILDKHHAQSILKTDDAQEIFDKQSKDLLCKETVDLYMRLYCRILRNATYAVLPYGGVYITNGVVEKNPELFTSPEFFQEFLNANNAQLLPILKEFPVYIVTDPNVKIYGAAQYLLMYEY